MICAYDEESTSLAELKAERDALRKENAALRDALADWQQCYTEAIMGLPTSEAVHRVLGRVVEENVQLKRVEP
jgi:hypothetical protein